MIASLLTRLRIVPGWAWWAAGGALALLALILWHSAQTRAAYKRGMADCTAAHAQAAAEWEKQNAGATRRAEAADSDRRVIYETRAAPIRERIIERVKEVPADCIDAGLRGLLDAQIAAGNNRAAASAAAGR